MQTFVPSTDFAECARVLDRQRLGEQRVECGQILSALKSLRLADSGPGVPRGWTRHPAVLMWRGYESALGVYMTFMVAEWAARGYVNNMTTPYSRETFLCNWGWEGAGIVFALDGRNAELPPWWGDERVHSSHRNALLYKNQEHYRQFQWGGMPILEYYWPVRGDAEWTPGAPTRDRMYRGRDHREKKSEVS